MQTFGLNRKPNRLANPEGNLRVDTCDGYPSISEACFKDDFRTQLLNHFDIGVEAALRTVATERKMLGPCAVDDHDPAAGGRARPVVLNKGHYVGSFLYEWPRGGL